MFYFQQWRPSWLGAGSSDTILKGDHPSTINLAKFRNTFFTANSGGFINSCKGYTVVLLVCMKNDFLASIFTDNSSHAVLIAIGISSGRRTPTPFGLGLETRQSGSQLRGFQVPLHYMLDFLQS